MSIQVLPTHTPELFAAAVRQAAALLGAGELVALPTETVYGLAASALNPEAVTRIFEVKGRPSHNPIIVHVASRMMARQCVREWPAAAEKLARAFWPGPLTMVLPRARGIPDAVTAGGDTVGVRWPSHPLMQEVIRACGIPLAAPSANRSTELSPTTAEHVVASLGDRIPLVVDGGPCQVGIESTVLDLTAVPPCVLRPGMIHAESLGAVLGLVPGREESGSGPLRSPGLLERHYSPRARLRVWDWADEADLRRRVQAEGVSRGRLFLLAHTRIPPADVAARVSVIPHDAEAFGRAIYAELHRCDDEGAELIVVEAVPVNREWAAIADRLRRASTS